MQGCLAWTHVNSPAFAVCCAKVEKEIGGAVDGFMWNGLLTVRTIATILESEEKPYFVRNASMKGGNCFHLIIVAVFILRVGVDQLRLQFIAVSGVVKGGQTLYCFSRLTSTRR